jgi:hypothetical protein
LWEFLLFVSSEFNVCAVYVTALAACGKLQAVQAGFCEWRWGEGVEWGPSVMYWFAINRYVGKGFNVLFRQFEVSELFALVRYSRESFLHLEKEPSISV